MAIQENYIDKITKDGESRPISPAADKVRVDNDNFEGDNLDDVLDEIHTAIGNAGSGDGTVTGVKVGNTPYNPDGEGVVDLSTPFNAKVDKETGKSLMTDAERTKLQNLPSDPVSSITVNGQAQQKDQNGNVNIEVQGGGLSKEDISVETQGDGTVDVNVKDDTYTINLNHTHENMAKLEIVDEEPSNPALDTIYALVNDASDPTEIQSLWIAGLEFVGGGGDPEPRLRFPTNGSQINLDDLASGGLFIRGYNLSQPLLVTVTGDFTINGGSTATVQATDANAGTTLTLACTSQSYNATGSLVITSSEGINTSCSLIANVPNYESITAAVFSGTQWVNMGFSVGPNTSFEWDVQFAEDSQIAGPNTTFFSCNSDRPSLFQANFASGSFGAMYFWVCESNVNKAGFSLGRGVFRYANRSCSYRSVTLSLPEVTFTASDFSLGTYRVTDEIFNCGRMIVFGLKVYENNELTHDFVPKKFDSVVGFYDNLTGAFVSSQTSTELEEYNS